MSPSVKSIEESPARLELVDVTIGYGPKVGLQHINLEVVHGAQVAVVGPNGAGKSTLFKALVGLLPLQAGEIYIHSQLLGHHQDCVAYLPQREAVDWRFPVTVKDVVCMGRVGAAGWFRRMSRKDMSKVEQAMDAMGIMALANEAIGDLSGGQQQRVFLARALAQEPHILLMDEPFTGIDAATQEITINLLHDLKRQGVTVMVSTHDLNLAASEFEHVLLLNREVVAFGNPSAVFQPKHLRKAFGSHFMELGGQMLVDDCCPGDESHGHHHD